MKAQSLVPLVSLALLLAHCGDDSDEPHSQDDAAVNAVEDGAVAGDGALVDAALRPSFGPPALPNSRTAPNGWATQHGDTAASDTTPLPGPGAAPVSVQRVDLSAACPSILIDSRGQPLAVCTQLANRIPTVYLLDAASGQPLAQLELAKGDLFGGVYPYLDHEDRLQVVDGANSLLRISPQQSGTGYTLVVEESISLAAPLGTECGRERCDVIVGLAPDYAGRIWFATAAGTVGVVDRATRNISTLALPADEQIANSLATAPEGVAVVSDHALYLLDADERGVPRIRSRSSYDRGVARKPGQLSQGSGSTPTFFGPVSGSEYVAITDNARPDMHLLVFRARDLSEQLCSVALPSEAGSGSENSPIGIGRSVFVSNTYGYAYPALPEGTGPSEPESASFAGGMARVDVAVDERSCSLQWSNPVRSTAVPKLSLPDGLIYTVERTLPQAGAESQSEGYAYSVIDAVDGKLVAQQPLPGLPDTLQLAGTIAPGRVLLQGTTLGLVRIQPMP